jgi:hypothetical protein
MTAAGLGFVLCSEFAHSSDIAGRWPGSTEFHQVTYVTKR